MKGRQHGAMLMSISRRRALLSAAGAVFVSPSWSQPVASDPLLATGLLAVGVERLAKLRLEQPLLPERAAAAQRRAQGQLEEALRQLRGLPVGRLAQLPARRQSQLASALESVEQFAAIASQPATRWVADSEALVARLGFVSTALSGLAGNPTQAEQAAQLDLFLRAAASALRVGKLNFAAIALPDQQGLRVGAAQALIEFSAALQAVGQQQLRPAQAQALQLAQQQWLLFRAALTEQGLAKGRERLPEVATTTERIADSLIAMARQA